MEKKTVANAPKINLYSVVNGITPPPFTDDNSLFSFQLLFDEAWGKKVFSLIKKANQEILIATFKLEICHKPRAHFLNALVEELIKAKQRGVKISLLLNIKSNFRSTSPANLYAQRWLSQYGIESKHLPRGRTCHLKILLVDKRFLIIGSHNWTVRSLSSNAEASLFLENTTAGQEIHAYFHRLWSNR